MAIKLKRGLNANFTNVKLEAGEPAFVTDTGKLYVGNGTTSVLINPTINASSVGLGNVTNESKTTMFTSPAFTGTPTATTAAAGTSTTQLATTAFVTTAVNNKTTITGNAGSATKLETARTIGGVAFDGTANITLTPASVGLGNVTNESKATMFTNAALTGTPTAPTQALGTNTRSIATTEFVQAAIGNIIIPEGVDVSGKANVESPEFTGTPKAPTAVAGTNTTQLATTAFVTTAVANKTTITGNAGSATKLATARTIAGVSFDGTANIAITADNVGAVPTARTVNGKALSANISITAADVGLGNVTNESKATMFANAALTGSPTAPTQLVADESTKIATTKYVIDRIDYDLNTYTATIIDNKADLDSPMFIGAPVAPTAAAGTNTTQLATTAFVATAVAGKTSVTGNAGTATKLAAARTIALTGDVTGSASFDGSANVTLTASVDGGTF